jgi:hypothetical protein
VVDTPLRQPFSVQDIRSSLAAAGVAITDDEARSLAVQAVPYFAMLDRLTMMLPDSLEPAVTFAIDRWVSGGDE